MNQAPTPPETENDRTVVLLGNLGPELSVDPTGTAAAGKSARQPTSAHGYHTVAAEFLAVVELLADHPGVALSPWVNSIAQTLECTLKAYIACLDPSKLGEPLKGHDLLRFWGMAVKTSNTATKKITIEQIPPAWCVMLNALHDDPFLDRYPVVHGMAVKTERAWLAGRLRTMLSEVDAAFE